MFLILIIISAALILTVIGLKFEKRRKSKIKAPDLRGQFTVVDGVKLHFQCVGSGPDIVLLHGLGANVYSWRKLIPLLAKNFKVWAVDLKGFGLSDKPLKSSYSLLSQAQLVVRFLEEQGVKKAAVVGNSMGGAIGAELGLVYPQIFKNIILINSAHDERMFNSGLRKLRGVIRTASSAAGLLAPMVNEISVGGYLHFLYGRRDYVISKEDVKAYIAPYVSSTDSHKAFIQAFEGLISHDLTTRLTTIQSRVLILWGKNDRILPQKYGQMLHEDLPGSTYLVHPTGGHHLQEEEPQWVADQITLFLR